MLIDSYGREVTYLRVSITERCNFRCQYCMPDKPFVWMPHEELLSFEELFEFIKIAIDDGITKIRLTGGEPLLRPHLDRLIAMINGYKSGLDIALTTNAFLLKDMAQKLYDAGLRRVNISLDSLKKDVAWKIAQKDVLDDVLGGIEEALRVGLKVKINCVPMVGINTDELLDIFEYCKERGMSIRFIEFMENTHASTDIKGLRCEQILDKIRTKYSFEMLEKLESSPAELFKCDDGYIFGVIDPHKHDFCATCNRIRLSSDGQLIPCLYFDEAQSVKSALKKHDFEEAKNILHSVVANKPEKNRWDEEVSNRAFYQTGG